MVRNCFLDFAVEHWFGFRTTEPGFAEVIGAIEGWLIDGLKFDWLIDWLSPSVINFPMLFALYTTPICSMISGHATYHHLFSDDTQLYVSFASGQSAAALNDLLLCFTSVQSWMLTNQLKLNPEKTEFLLIGNERQHSKYIFIFPVKLFCVIPRPAKSAQNLGVTFDGLCSHVLAVCSLCFYHILDLRHVHRCLIWMVQVYLQLLLCLVVSIAAIQFAWYREHWPHETSMCSESTGHRWDNVAFIYSQCSTASFLSSISSKV